jgi:hypothetical protein
MKTVDEGNKSVVCSIAELLRLLENGNHEFAYAYVESDSASEEGKWKWCMMNGCSLPLVLSDEEAQELMNSLLGDWRKNKATIRELKRKQRIVTAPEKERVKKKKQEERFQ